MQPARSRILFVCLLQSLALVLLLVGARHGWLPLYLALPLGVALLWLPWLLPGNRTAVATVGEPDIARLARDLSHNTSQNALSAAGVAFSVKRLAEKLQSQLDAAEQIVGSAEVMIHTERATSTGAPGHGRRHPGARRQRRGQVLLASTIERMHRLSERMGASREAIEALNQRSEDIQRVTLVIQGIASQTNLLALNAAIEAARAGEHGRGFAVVAEEVRGLAGRTAEATEEVGQMVAEIQRQTSEVVEQIRQLSKELGEGVGQVELTGRQLEGIAELAAGVESQITEIAQGAEINRSQLASLFAAVEQVRGDLSASEEQTLRLGEAASQLENQAEVISERLAEVSLDAYHQSVYDLAWGAAAIAARFEEDARSGASTSTTCSTAATSRCPIPSRPSTGPASTATPTRSCRASRSSCWSATATWCSPSPVPPKATCPPTIAPSPIRPAATRRRTRCAAAASACSTTAPGFAAAATSSRCCYRPTPVTPAS